MSNNGTQIFSGNDEQVIYLAVNYERLFKKMDGLASHATDEVRRNVLRVILQNQRRILRRYVPTDTGWLATKIGTRISKPNPSSPFYVSGTTFPIRDVFFVRRIPKAERFSVRIESNAERKKRLANYEVRGLNGKIGTRLVNLQTFRMENGVVKIVARNSRKRLANITERPSNVVRKTETEGNIEARLLQTVQRLQAGYRVTSKTKGVSSKLIKASHEGAITLRKRLPWAESYWHEYGTKFMAARYPFARAAQAIDPQTKSTFRDMEARIYERYGRMGTL